MSATLDPEKSIPLEILYMEDDPGQARLFQRKMRRLGHIVEIAVDGQVGLERLEQKQFDIVVVDHNMPIYDGMQVLREMDRRGPFPPTVMLTGAGDEVIAVEAMKLGAEDYLVKDVDGHYLKLFPSIVEGILRNQRIHDEKEAALHALQQSEEKFRAMFEFAPFGMVLCDRSGNLLRFNDSFVHIVDKTPEFLKTTRLDSFLFSKPNCEDMLEELEQTGCIAPFELPFQLSEKVSLWLQVSGTSYAAEREGEHRVWLFIEDITGRKAMFEELIQSSKLKAVGELAANIAHEMNNPLGIISAKARLLLSHESERMSQKVARELGKMIDQCDRLTRLTRGILDYSRPSLGTQRPISVLEPLRRSVAMVGERAQERHVQLCESYTEENVTILGNSHELEQVFLNLFLNAIEAMPEGGKLLLSTSIFTESKEDPEEHLPVVRIGVQDTGEGISEEILPYIFEPFYTTKEEGRGTGLGLAICHGLIRSHKGHIHVSSEEGQGTLFEITIPLLVD